MTEKLLLNENKNKAFTLVEILVAMAVLGLLLGLMSNFTSTGIKLFESGSWHQVQMTKTNIAMRKILDELKQCSNYNFAQTGTEHINGVDYTIPKVTIDDRPLLYEPHITSQAGVKNQFLYFQINTMSVISDAAGVYSTTVKTSHCRLVLDGDTLFYLRKDSDSLIENTPVELLNQIESINVSHQDILDFKGRPAKAGLLIEITLKNPNNEKNTFKIKRNCTVNVTAKSLINVPETQQIDYSEI